MSTKENMFRFDAKSSKLSAHDKWKKALEPFSAYTAPEVDVYCPLTKGRMGFFIVFDVNSIESYKEALNVHKMFEEELQAQNTQNMPIVYLVGNKIDKNPKGEDPQRVIKAASDYATDKMLRFWQVSATEATRVREMFMEMVQAIRAHQNLWLLDENVDGPMDDRVDGSDNCTVQ